MDNAIDYKVNSQKGTQLIVAGLTASVAMMAFAYLMRAMGITAPDFAAQYGAILNDQIYPTAFSGLWWTGLVWHAINGAIIFAVLYDYLAHRRVLPNMRQAKGLLYGLTIWVFVGLVIAPLAGEGLFFRNLANSFGMNVTSLLSWLIYGFVLDEMTRMRIVHHLGLSEKRAA